MYRWHHCFFFGLLWLQVLVCEPSTLDRKCFFLITSSHTREYLEWRPGVVQSQLWYWLFGIHHVFWRHIKSAFLNMSLPLQWRCGLHVNCSPGWRASKFTLTLNSFTNVQYTGPYSTLVPATWEKVRVRTV